MALDPKVIGGGVAVVAIGGGSGYAISQVVDSSDKNQNSDSSKGKNVSQELTPEQIKNTNKKALTDAGFEINITKESQKSCKDKLEEKVFSAEKDFKNAVKECVVGKKFSDKASLLGLDVLKNDNENNWDSGDSWWNANKNEISKIITSATSNSNWTTIKTHVVSFCTQTATGAEANKGNKDINENSTDEDWKKFLKACTKDKATKEEGKETRTVILTKDFWTNKTKSTQS